jgi:hypothetical protein
MADPNYRGVFDANYVRPAPTEFPKIVYRKDEREPKGYRTKIVKSREEQDALGKGWLTTAAEVHALLDPIASAQYRDPEEEVLEEKKEKAASKGK